MSDLATAIGQRRACAVLGASRATLQRHHHSIPAVATVRRASHRRLTESERQAIRDAAHSERFADLSAREIYATLLDEGTYLGSISTIYRVLREAGETRERRRQATHPARVKPESPPRGRVKSGPGTSRSCSARPSGRTTISTSSSISIAATSSHGGLKPARALRSLRR